MHQTLSHQTNSHLTVSHRTPRTRHRRIDGALVATTTFALLVLGTGIAVFVTAG